MKNKLIFSLLLLSVLTACEKEVHIDLNSADPLLVIEANVNDASGPYYVKLTRTVNFSEANNFPVQSGALVTIQDEMGAPDTLVEMSPGYYQTVKLVGQAGHQYLLRIDCAGKHYEAISTMPYKVKLDSIRFNPVAAPGSSGMNFATIPLYLDPPTTGNNYRFIQKINSQLDPSYYVANDNVGNGIINPKPLLGRQLIQAGDTVALEMRCIDLASYNYFYTLSQMSGAAPGGGTTPSNPPNNITGDKALGYFAAYTTEKKVVIAK